MEFHTVGAELFHAKKTDRHDEVVTFFRNFAKAPYKEYGDEDFSI